MSNKEEHQEKVQGIKNNLLSNINKLCLEAENELKEIHKK